MSYVLTIRRRGAEVEEEEAIKKTTPAPHPVLVEIAVSGERKTAGNTRTDRHLMFNAQSTAKGHNDQGEAKCIPYHKYKF